MKKFLGSVAALLLLLAVSPAAYAQTGFGRSVAIADGQVLIGEPTNVVTSGIVYVYQPEDGSWVESARLTAPDAADGDGFGTALLQDGRLLLVSAVNDERGVVYLFERDQHGAWSAAGTLQADGVEGTDGFGRSLALTGDLLVVGAPGAADGWGAAHVFQRQGDAWLHQAVLAGDRPEPEPAVEADEEASEAPDADDDAQDAEDDTSQDQPEPTPEQFGSAVGLIGDLVVVGAPGAGQQAGAVYTFRHADAGWEQTARLDDGAEEGWRLGREIATHGEQLYVGAPGASSFRGAVEVFSIQEDSGELVPRATLTPFDGTRFTQFGAAIAFDGEDLLVGAPGGNRRRGLIYRFDRDSAGNWAGVSKIAVGSAGRGAAFGGVLAIDGDVLVAAMPGADFGAGSAMIMTRTFGGWDRDKVFSEVKSFEPITGHRVECVDGKVGRFPCQGVDLLAYLPIPAIGGGRGVMANDIWGWTDPDTGHDYAIVGLSNGTSFVDVTDPYNPVYVGKLPKTSGAHTSVWRDIKVYADHAFIVSDAAGAHGMQVFDLKSLRKYQGEPVTFSESAHYDNIFSAHNIVINEESAFAFIVGASGGGETCGGGLHMVNIEDPNHPMFAGCFQDTRTGRRGTGYSHDAECVLYEGPDERYQGHEICFGSNETALSIADVTDKRNPRPVGMASYPNVAYTHQGWLTADQRYFYMDDEGDEASGLVPGTRTIIWDVQDLEDPIVVGEYVSDNPAVDHNLYIVGPVMYQSNYDSGLRVYDVSDPGTMRPVGYLDTVPYGKDGGGMGGSWSNYPYFKSGVVVVTSMNEGLFVAKVRDDALAKVAGSTEK